MNSKPFPLPLRLRLTLWYMFSLAVILALFASLLYVQLRRSLLTQVDAALQLAAAQALINLEEDGGQITFQGAEHNPEAIRRLQDDFVIHVVAPDGTALATLTSDDDSPQFPLHPTGFRTLTAQGEPWRFYSQNVTVGSQAVQLQVAQELDPIEQTLASLRSQLLLGLPLAFLMAGLGGYFLAWRALRPIDHITHTAQAISADDLSQRIHYQGTADEVGRLAQTFDTMLDRLQAAFARERRFTGDASHELRTPLAALKGRIGVTLSQPRPPAEYQETLQEMEQQVDRLIRLSNDLLFMARLDQGQFPLRQEKIELRDLIGAVVEQVRPLATAKAILLTETIPSHLVIHGQIDLLIRLFLNLLDNAIKYTPANGSVAIHAHNQGQNIVVTVHDTGPGIAPEHLAYLFERFYRVEDDRARRLQDNGQGGAGLGLAIAYEIARTHGGLLSVQSEVGQGTTFFIQLPDERS